MISNVETDQTNSDFWCNNNAIATTGVNTCLSLVYFYTEQGCRRILLRHIWDLITENRMTLLDHALSYPC
jgi:hypothetical protein